MRVTLKAVNAELARRGHQVLLEKASGYFYFRTGEAADWLDRTVPVARVSDLTLDQWVAKFRELKRVNQDILKSGKDRPPVRAERLAGNPAGRCGTSRKILPLENVPTG